MSLGGSRVLAIVNSFITHTILSIVSDMSQMFSQATKVSIFLLIRMVEFFIRVLKYKYQNHYVI